MTLLELLGPAAIPTIVCLITGLVLLIIELITPGIGVPGILGAISLLAVIIMQILWGTPTVAIYLTAGILLLIVASILLVFRSLQKGRLSNSFLVLKESIDAVSTENDAAAAESLLGKSGITLTALRPAGIAEIEGRRIDVKTDAQFLEANTPIIVTEVQGLHVLVRKVD